MGAEGDRAQSRPPRLEDLLFLCRALNEEGARYLLVGGFAMILHGYARGTMDVDFLEDDSAENIRAVKKALAKLPDNAAKDVADSDVKTFTVVRVGDEIVVDLIGSACGVDFAQAWPKALKTVVQGVEIPYADAGTLIQTKDTPRPKDKQDILFLKQKLQDGRTG